VIKEKRKSKKVKEKKEEEEKKPLDEHLRIENVEETQNDLERKKSRRRSQKKSHDRNDGEDKTG
jgi:hypothetical protein